mgnify:CR=1 FL=1
MNLIKKIKNYFTPSKIKELEEKIAQIQKNQIKDVLHPIKFEFKGIAEEKLIQKCIYNVGTKNIDVVFTDGDVISGVVEQYTYDQIRNATSKEEVLNLLIPKNIKGSDYDIDKEEEDIKTQIAPIVSILSEIDNFEVVGEDVFLKGVKSIAIPSSIVAEFIRIVSEIQNLQDNSSELIDYEQLDKVKEEYNSLLMFTYKILLNPLKESREQLLNFVKKNDAKITSFGNLVLYRACWEAKSESDALVKFVAKEYLKIKSWKKSPKNYEVFDDNGLVIIQREKRHDYNNHKGNLAELYSKLPEMQSEGKQYYSDHGKKKIVIGDIYKIDDSEVNLDSGVCHSGGLHLAAVDYNYSGYGDTNLICLLNPSKTITVPSSEIKKLRCSEMMVVGINPNERGVHIEEGFYSNLDENYHNYSLEVLQEALKNKSFEPISVSTEVTELTIKEVANVTDILRNRVVEIV